jgi:hydrogenase expression/formation protein HypD
MRFLDEYRDPELAQRLLSAIRRAVTRPWTVMEVCGGQTHSLVRSGITDLLPGELTLVHGPGCPVCVTPLELIDRALAIAALPEVIFCSFGDMLRVPGSRSDLLRVRAEGGDVRPVYSPLDAVRLARENPTRQVVFFAVGFETTAPATALAALQARRLGLTNFSLLVAHVLVPPAMEAVLAAPESQVQGFLAAGHVCTVMGYRDYDAFAAQHRVPVVVTGFEPIDLLEGIWMLVSQLEAGRCVVENQYARAARAAGNRSAQQAVAEVYEACDRPWRGLGVLPRSGLRLKPAHRDFDAEARFPSGNLPVSEPTECRAGDVLRGLLRPVDCPAFGRRCTPEQPLGAPMVSSEGACAAYWQHRRLQPSAIRFDR